MGALTSARMRQVIEEASANFEWVVIDTPPVGLLSDANLLAAMVDMIVLVIGAGLTPYRLIERAVAALNHGRIVGVVLNRVVDAHASHHYYGYYDASAGSQGSQ
jgi:tyrosine-protein kinase